MVSHENRVLLVSTVTVAVVSLAAMFTGFADGSAAFALLVVAGIGILGPQLYLAATDDEISTHSRVRTGVVLTILYSWSLFGMAKPPERPIVGVATAALLVGLLAYEFRAGYRASVG